MEQSGGDSPLGCLGAIVEIDETNVGHVAPICRAGSTGEARWPLNVR
jgi:hypothetical protein